MKKVLCGIVLFQFMMNNGNAQDTLIITGTFVTQIDNLRHSTSSKSTLISTMDFLNIFSNYLVKTDNVLKYNSCVSSAIYVTSNTFSLYPLLQDPINKYGATKMINFIQPSIDYYTEYPSGKVWKNESKDNVLFYVIQCKLKCVSCKTIKLTIGDVDAKKKKDAFRTIEPTLYYITEVMSVKLIKPVE